jgi:outer membrane protein OmpA-like peptidoglycan-associated protein
MRRWILFSLLIFSLRHVAAQSTNISNIFQSNFRKAEIMYGQQGYRNAIDMYRVVLDHDPHNHQAKERVAECYFRMGMFREAKHWYSELTEEKNPKAEAYYQLGQIFSILGQYDSAKIAFEQYTSLNPSDKRGPHKTDFINHLSFYRKDSGSYQIVRQWYNSKEADFSPQHFGEGIVFVSSRDRDLFIKRKSLSAINETEGLLNAFYANPSFDSTQSMDSQVSLFYSKALNSPYHDGPVTFYDNGKRIAFTRNILQNGKPVRDEMGRVNLELYFASLGENRTLTKIDRFPFNSPSYSIAHPWISPDGTVLYFSSNMPGGYGGADVYESSFISGKWSEPKNLGENINTAGDEYSPFLWNNELLYFSSNGLGGFGGLDIFVSRKSDQFASPQNVGSPINSSRDDFGLIADLQGREGYFASNRNDDNDDIFKFIINKAFVMGQVRELQNHLPVPLASVVIKCEQDSLLNRKLNADESGRFTIELAVEKKYKVEAHKEGYTSLEPETFYPQKYSLIADTLQVNLWKNELFAKGIVYSNEQQKALSNAMVYLSNLSTGKTDSIRTGDMGTYNFLVLPNSSYRITARYPGYLENGFNLNTKALFRGSLLNDILLEEKYLEKLTILFDYNKWDVRPEFIVDLQKVIRSLKHFKNAIVYIGAHADSQGTREYNKKLSDKRAQSVVRFLNSSNIPAGRIQAYGFGEELILNLCSDGVECTNEEHSLNRRAEIKVLMEENK